MRRFAIFTASLLTTVVGFLTGAASAFAVNVDPSGDGGPRAAQISHSAGLAVWQTSLLVVAGIVVATTLATVARRTSRRSTVRHAIH